MMRRLSTVSAIKTVGLAVGLAIGLAACESAPPFKVTGIQLSNKIDEGNRVYSPGSVFDATSTVYASIATEGAGSATLDAQWLNHDGTVFDEQTQKIEQTEPKHYEFHYKPEGGWEAGKRYTAHFTVDGGQKRTREFEIR